jgi:hypothetical protein
LALPTQLAAKLFLFLSIAERGPGAHGLGSVNTAGSQVFLLVFVAEKGPGTQGLESFHPAELLEANFSYFCQLQIRDPVLMDLDLSTAGSQAFLIFVF